MLESKSVQAAPPPVSAAAPMIDVRWAGIADRAAVVKVLQRAFADYDGMQPPPGALGETEASVRAHLELGPIALAFIEGAPVGESEEQLAARIRGALAPGVTMLGFSPEAIGRAVRRGLGDA